MIQICTTIMDIKIDLLNNLEESYNMNRQHKSMFLISDILQDET